MTPQALTALKGSIKKWQAIVRSPKAPDLASENCPLCKEFLRWNLGTGLRCDGCPVAQRTQEIGCDGSPYDRWTDHREEGNHPSALGRYPGCSTCLDLAKQELVFLQSLLPKGARP